MQDFHYNYNKNKYSGKAERMFSTKAKSSLTSAVILKIQIIMIIQITVL